MLCGSPNSPKQRSTPRGPREYTAMFTTFCIGVCPHWQEILQCSCLGSTSSIPLEFHSNRTPRLARASPADLYFALAGFQNGQRFLWHFFPFPAFQGKILMRLPFAFYYSRRGTCACAMQPWHYCACCVVCATENNLRPSLEAHCRRRGVRVGELCMLGMDKHNIQRGFWAELKFFS